jgi:hypothetical protein
LKIKYIVYITSAIRRFKYIFQKESNLIDVRKDIIYKWNIFKNEKHSFYVIYLWLIFKEHDIKWTLEKIVKTFVFLSKKFWKLSNNITIIVHKDISKDK